MMVNGSVENNSVICLNQAMTHFCGNLFNSGKKNSRFEQFSKIMNHGKRNLKSWKLTQIKCSVKLLIVEKNQLWSVFCFNPSLPSSKRYGKTVIILAYNK